MAGDGQAVAGRGLRVPLDARTCTFVLVAITLVSGALGLLAEWLVAAGHPVALGFAAYFDPARESSLPEWFSTVVDALAALAVAGVAFAEPARGLRWRWAVLALFLTTMSAGEGTAILDQRLPLLDLLRVAPGPDTALAMRGGIVLVLTLVAAALWPLARQVGRTRTLLGMGCALLVLLGQSGLGWLGSQLGRRVGMQDVRYLLAHVGEETLETLGAALFLGLVLGYIESRGGLWFGRDERTR